MLVSSNSFHFFFSDKVKKACKIHDEYFMVKDLVLPKETYSSNRNPVTGAYPSNQGLVSLIRILILIVDMS